jgi:hypothetical protein
LNVDDFLNSGTEKDINIIELRKDETTFKKDEPKCGAEAINVNSMKLVVDMIDLTADNGSVI